MADPPTAPQEEAPGYVQVGSGAVCFGERHNILHGAGVPVQAPALRLPQCSGTVITHATDFNIAAKNGRWAVYPLRDLADGAPRAWLVCHEDVDPRAECDRILRISGSPYEADSGWSKNCAQTWEGRVVVINRYDWGYYDGRCEDQVQAPEGDAEALAPLTPTVGLVDYAHATSRTWGPHGTWLACEGEYSFGRFGLTEDRAEAQSFLFFTAETDFTRTRFPGAGGALRERLSPAERYARRLAAGETFDGLEALRECGGTPPPDVFAAFHWEIFAVEDLVALQAGLRDGRCLPLEVRLLPDSHALCNELCCSFLAAHVAPALLHGPERPLREVAAAVFPRHDVPNTVDQFAHARLVAPPAVTKLKATEEVAARARAFLAQCGVRAALSAVLSAAQVYAVLEWLLCEVLELAHNGAQDNWRPAVVPRDIRMAVYLDQELCAKFGRCHAMWSAVSPAPGGTEAGAPSAQ